MPTSERVSKGTEMTLNNDLFAKEIKDWIEDVDDLELKFLCDECARIYDSIDDECIDNFRISRIDSEGMVSIRYLHAAAAGCCGAIYETVKNPVTGNKFFVGFNYGH